MKTHYDLASEYALSHTSTRCAKMRNTENCEECTVRNCDFRARYEAYIEGYEQRLDEQLNKDKK